MFVVATIMIILGMVLTLMRLFGGPTVYDRVLAVNLFGTLTVLLIAVKGFLSGRPDFLDIALLYALINFVGTIAVLKFFRYRAIGDYARTRDDEEEQS
ncbi:monovalent cation/H+ antiporter complex subunit F [Marimonas arenosa]|uniref:Monovalent cation/H+ antiporter complex subunit F n=1 Tax=Marimonas arenosa TaxID=1795305 RepID=A0AAE4B5L8_9RHOB|nr:monovalent cation/H+ antiporter complex subunit F [Marimonas arenosa]MDQ2092163.1 monovalent cation/H+ antiporter complex subunit F [Marimonas arenosa]